MKYVPVYKSETKKAAAGGLMKWNQVQIGTSDLCRDEGQRPFKFEFFRSVPTGKHVCVGSC